MNNLIKLEKVAAYAEGRVTFEGVSLENFVTVDNMLPNKGGITIAVNLPPQGSRFPAFKPENILVGNIRPYLKKIWFADREGGATADVLVFEAKDGYYPKFVYYAMLRDDFFAHMMRGKKGSKMPRGDKKQILNFLVPNYKYTVQEDIATVLSVLDAKIEINNRINAELEEMAKTLYSYWFVQFDFPNAKGKPYKSSGGKMVLNADLKREIPDGWAVGTIESVLAKQDSVPKIPASEILSKGSVPVVDQSTDFIAGFTNKKESIIKADEPRIIFGDHTRILKFINFDFARGADGTQILLSKDKRIPQHLFFHSLQKIDLSNYGYARYFKFLKESKIVLPSVDVASMFVDAVKTNYEVIKHNIFENQKLAELRDWLLPMLMNGQVKVK